MSSGSVELCLKEENYMKKCIADCGIPLMYFQIAFKVTMFMLIVRCFYQLW